MDETCDGSYVYRDGQIIDTLASGESCNEYHITTDSGNSYGPYGFRVEDTSRTCADLAEDKCDVRVCISWNGNKWYNYSR